MSDYIKYLRVYVLDLLKQTTQPLANAIIYS